MVNRYDTKERKPWDENRRKECPEREAFGIKRKVTKQSDFKGR